MRNVRKVVLSDQRGEVGGLKTSKWRRAVGGATKACLTLTGLFSGRCRGWEEAGRRKPSTAREFNKISRDAADLENCCATSRQPSAPPCLRCFPLLPRGHLEHLVSGTVVLRARYRDLSRRLSISASRIIARRRVLSAFVLLCCPYGFGPSAIRQCRSRAMRSCRSPAPT